MILIRRSAEAPATRLLAAVAGLIVTAGCAWLAPFPLRAAPTPPSAEESLNALVLEAELGLAAKEYEYVINLMAGPAERADAPPELGTILAEAYLGARNEERALETLDRTIERYPDYIPARLQRANVYRRLRRLDDAIADLEAAAERAPTNGRILEEIGFLRLRAVREWTYSAGVDSPVARLINVYRRLVELRSGSQKIIPLVILTSIFSQVGHHEEAIEAALQATQIRATDIRGHLALAEAYERAGRTAEAFEAYRQALLLDPGREELQRKIAQLIAQTNRPGGVLAFWRELAEEFPRDKAVQDFYGEELLRAGEFADAAEHFKSVMDAWPEDGRARRGWALAAFMSAGPGDLAQVTARLLEAGGLGGRETLDIAEALRSVGKVDAAAEILAQRIERDGATPRLLFALAGDQLRLGRKAEATATLERLVEMRPEMVQAVSLLSEFYREAGRTAEAEALLERALAAAGPREALTLRLRQAELLRARGEIDRARQTLDGILAAEGEIPEEALRMRVDLDVEAGDFASAHATVDRYLARLPDERSIGVRSLKAWLFWREKRYGEAVAVLEELYRQESGNWPVIQFLAENYGQLGEYEKAHGLLQAAESVLEERFRDEILLARVQLYRRQQDLDRAVEVMERLLGRNPDQDAYLIMAGEFYHELGRMEDAERVLRRAIEINPRNAEAYNALGYFFAEAGVKLDEALVLVQRALELKPDAGHILDSLGWVYYKQGQYGKAVQTLEAAVQKLGDSPDPIILDHLGDAYDKEGRREEALHYWRRALDLDPDADQIRSKLDRP